MKYLWKLLALTVCLFLLGLTLPHFFDGVISKYYWASILFLFLLTWGSDFFIKKAKERSAEKFVNVFLISTVTRFIFAGFTVVCLVVILKERAKLEILNFIAVYFCFLWFEIMHLSANLRAISNRELKDADESSI